MTQPTAFVRTANYTEYATLHPAAPFPPASLDAEFNNALVTLAGILTNLVLLQDDDGSLKNLIVTPDTLSSGVIALIGSAGFTVHDPIGWVTGTVYPARCIVTSGGPTYVSVVGHTAGVFAVDLAAGKWVVIDSTTGSFAASAVVFTPVSDIAATDVQGAVTEVAAERAKLAGLSTQAFAVATATGATHAVPAAQVQNGSLWYAEATGTGDAMLATIATPGITVLIAGFAVRIKAPGANGTSTPTLNLTLGATATGAIVVKDGAGATLGVGAITGAGHQLILVFDGTNWLLNNPGASLVSSVWVRKTAAYTAVSGQKIKASTVAGAWPLTFPAAPADGEEIEVQDTDGTFNTNALTLLVNGKKIMGYTPSFVLDTQYLHVVFVYDSVLGDWRI